MSWRMPAETAPHERTWMAFPRDGQRSATTPAEREEGYAAWTAVAHAVAEFEPRHDGRRPDRDRERAAHAVERDRDHRGAARRVLDARLRPDVRRRRRAARRARRGRLDLQRLGRARVGRVAASRPRSPASSPTQVGAELVSSVLVNEGGGIHVDGEGTVLVTETVQLDPRRNPYADQRARRGRARPHDRHDHTRLAAARTHPRLRRLRHQRARRHRRDDPVARPAAAAPPAEPRAPRLRGDARAARAARRARRMPPAAPGTSSTCPRPRPCATTRASSTGATSTTWS